MPDYSNLFPYRIVGDKNANSWPYLRREIAHNWYIDQRQPSDGFINVDETSVLYACAQRARGIGIEIGSLRGWSTIYLASALDFLTTIDPVFLDPARYAETQQLLKLAGVDQKCKLIPGYSPEAISLAAASNQPWSFAFIDGNHDGDAPRIDVQHIIPHMASSSAILFHDLVSPDVSSALFYLNDNGWSCKIYQTMQIMGLAYRGNYIPPSHQPDPHQKWTTPTHLINFL